MVRSVGLGAYEWGNAEQSTGCCLHYTNFCQSARQVFFLWVQFAEANGLALKCRLKVQVVRKPTARPGKRRDMVFAADFRFHPGFKSLAGPSRAFHAFYTRPLATLQTLGGAMNRSRQQRTYLIRLWPVGRDGSLAWRASILDVHSGEQEAFAEPTRVIEFLQDVVRRLTLVDEQTAFSSWEDPNVSDQ